MNIYGFKLLQLPNEDRKRVSSPPTSLENQKKEKNFNENRLSYFKYRKKYCGGGGGGIKNFQVLFCA